MSQDQVIICVDCQQQFVWTAGEQKFYQEKQLSAPTRCPICRATYKAARKDQFRGKIKDKV